MLQMHHNFVFYFENFPILPHVNMICSVYTFSINITVTIETSASIYVCLHITWAIKKDFDIHLKTTQNAQEKVLEKSI